MRCRRGIAPAKLCGFGITIVPGMLTPPQSTEGGVTMVPDASGWRSSALYLHVDELAASDIAWEWLRRNEAYDHDFDAYSRSKENPQSLTDRIQRQWGLRFPA